MYPEQDDVASEPRLARRERRQVRTSVAGSERKCPSPLGMLGEVEGAGV